MLFELIVWLLLTCVTVVTSARSKNSLVMTFIVRDEAVNIKSNLPLWATVIDYFVFMVDERTSDGTEDAIAEVLGNRIPYEIVYHQFSGFGPARTKSLSNAWKYFPQATHVWIADPDWKPELDTIHLDDLDTVNDAFRFLIYDRNGISTRRCDWLLRHREGLAMRYHLHEVLDIGESYSPIGINWVVREIEQSGSWHTTVGHGHSMSAQRYVFDLEMLEKDRELYGHDPHTHHYLGITHQAYVERLLDSNGYVMTDEIQYHATEAIKYLKLRILSTYKSEFMEERWACMYSLGTLYAQYLGDTENGLRWMRACHDYSPKQTECALAIVHIQQSQGQLRPAFEMMQVVLRTEHEDRAMLNHFKHWICDVPNAAVQVLSNVGLYDADNFAVEDAKYLRLVAAMATSSKCAEYGVFLTQNMIDTVQHVSRSYALSAASISDYQHLCRDKSMKGYLLRNKYTLHPCEQIRLEQGSAYECKDFQKFVTSPSERQSLLVEESFTGAASLVDIVHHAHAGFAGRLTKNPGNNGRFRVLFAEHFTLENAFGFISDAVRRNLDSALDITFLSSIENFEFYFKAKTQQCLQNRAILEHVSFVTRKRGQSMEDALKGLADGSESSYFDYVEYNNGMSLGDSYIEDLRSLQKVIGKHGVIGISMFMKSHYFSRIRHIVDNMNTSAHIPLSTNPERALKMFLEAHKLDEYAKDPLLVAALSLPNLRAFSKSEAEAVVADSGLSVLSWLPTATMNPYGMIQNSVVQSYMSYGITEQDFMEHIASHFRATVYVGRSDNSLPGKADMANNHHMTDRTVFVDRVGNLENIFSVAPERAKNSQSLAFNIAIDMHKPANVVMKMTLLPYAMAPFALLSRRPTLNQMLHFNEQTLGRPNDPKSRQIFLRQLATLEIFNFITIWTDGFPEGMNSEIVSEKKKSSDNIKESVHGLKTSHSNPQGTSSSTSTKHTEGVFQEIEKRVAGLKKMGFSDETIAKVIATIPSTGVSLDQSQPDAPQPPRGVIGAHGLKFSPTATSTSTAAGEGKTDTNDEREKYISGLKKMGFSDAAIAKLVADVPHSGVLSSQATGATTAASSSVNPHQVSPGKTGAINTGKLKDGLKKMGFPDTTISKFMSSVPSSGVQADVNNADDTDNGIPAVCRIAGVNGGDLCKPPKP